MSALSEDSRLAIDVVVVLGAQNDRDGTLSDMAVERAEGALRAYKERRGAKLLLTSSYGHFNQTKEPHTFYMAQYLLARGVSIHGFLPFVDSVNTVEDAAYSKQALAGRPIRSICVVTSAVHLTRARLRPTLKAVSLRLPVSLLESIKVAAHKRDVPYHSLMKMLLVEGIERELYPIKEEEEERHGS